MATARPFAYNTGSSITGTTQVGNLAVGYPTAGFAATGLLWWNGPDEDLGYVSAVPVSGGGQPNPLGISANVGFYRSNGLTDQAFVNAVNSAFFQNLSTASACLSYLSTNGYWTSYVESVAVTFSRTFTNGQAPGTTIENAWTTFRSQLTGTYTTMSLSNNLGGSITVTDATKVQNIANALRTATTGTDTTVTIGANTWRIAHGCVSGTPDVNSIYLTTGGLCSCAGSYTVRPMIKNANWGGFGSSCNQATQTITLTFS